MNKVEYSDDLVYITLKQTFTKHNTLSDVSMKIIKYTKILIILLLHLERKLHFAKHLQS